MPFATEYVEAEILPSGLYRLTSDLVYRGKTDTFTVPAGYVTDLSSVPRAFTALVPIAGRHDRAAIVHDLLCSHLDAGTPLASSNDSDGVFRRILRELGVPLTLRWLLWTGARFGALTNPARRAGWLTTAPAVLCISVLALPFVAPVAVVTAVALAVGGLLEGVARLVGRRK